MLTIHTVFDQVPAANLLVLHNFHYLFSDVIQPRLGVPDAAAALRRGFWRHDGSLELESGLQTLLVVPKDCQCDFISESSMYVSNPLSRGLQKGNSV